MVFSRFTSSNIFRSFSICSVHRFFFTLYAIIKINFPVAIVVIVIVVDGGGVVVQQLLFSLSLFLTINYLANWLCKAPKTKMKLYKLSRNWMTSQPASICDRYFLLLFSLHLKWNQRIVRIKLTLTLLTLHLKFHTNTHIT